MADSGDLGKPSLEDNDVLSRIREGDRDAHSEIMRRYGNYVYSIARRVLSDERLAEEAAQDAFLKAFRSLDDFRGESRFSTWLYRITWTTSISKHRAEVRHRSDGLEDNTEQLASSSSSFDSIAQDNRKQLIQIALKQLRPEEAVVLTLFYLEEQQLTEIAEVVGSNVNAVKVRLHRARKHLRAVLQKQLREEVQSL